MDFGGGAVEFVIPDPILDSDIPALVIEFVGDICVSTRYAGEDGFPMHSMTYLVLEDRPVTPWWPDLENRAAVSPFLWRCGISGRLRERMTTRTGRACDLCQDARGAIIRAAVGFLDMSLYRKRDWLPNTASIQEAISVNIRYEDKNICELCEIFICNHHLSRMFTPLEFEELTEQEQQNLARYWMH